ncbi:MAG TPA: hypothetical protein VFS23_36415 [Vicinamibacterales bacterium]|nr:hypothetical protein [Vicinamibacterales bacterium]
MTRPFCGAAAAAITVVALAAEPAQPDHRAVQALETFLSGRTLARQYTATRRLEASGSGQRGWIDVRTQYATSSGFRYDVTAEGGSGLIRGRVLKSLLEEEKQLIASGTGARVALTRDNYAFTPEGINEDGHVVVAMRPLRKEKSLISGRLIIDTDGILQRVEGQLAKNPSFWVTRVSVVRTYRRINGTLMPVCLETTARLRFLGSSSLRMTYDYSEIDDQPVDDGGL